MMISALSVEEKMKRTPFPCSEENEGEGEKVTESLTKILYAQ